MVVCVCVGSVSSSRKCSKSGCEKPADVDFDSGTLPGYNSVHAAQKTQLYCKLLSLLHRALESDVTVLLFK